MAAKKRRSGGTLWAGGSFIQAIGPGDMKEKMKTFHGDDNKEIVAACRKCGKGISAHHRDWHDCLCDGCFDREHFSGGRKGKG